MTQRYLSLTASTEGEDQHRRLHSEMTSIMEMFVGTVNTISLTSSKIQDDYEEEEYFDDETMFKVYDAIMGCLPMNAAHARDIINAMQNAGILFREKRGATVLYSGSAEFEDGDRARSAIGDG